MQFKIEYNVDSFSLLPEANISSLYHLQGPVNLMDHFETNQKGARPEHSDLELAEAEKKILKHVRFFRTSVALDSVSFSAETLRSVDKLLKHFNTVSGDQLFNKRNPQVDTKFPLPQWFRPRWRVSVASWIVAHFEGRILELYHNNKALRGHALEGPQWTSERLSKTWIQIPEEQKVQMLRGTFDKFDSMPEACFHHSPDNGKKRVVFSAEERIFAMLLRINRLNQVNASQLKDSLLNQLMMRRKEEGEKNFIPNLFFIEPKHCFSLYSFFGSLLVTSVIDFASKQVLNELGKDPNKKKQKSLNKQKGNPRSSKAENLKPDNNCKMLEPKSSIYGCRVREESDETNEDERVSLEKLSCLRSEKAGPLTPELKEPKELAVPLQRVASISTPQPVKKSIIQNQNKPPLTWNSDEEEVVPTVISHPPPAKAPAPQKRPKLRKNVPNVKKSKTPNATAEPSEKPKRESALVVPTKKWDDDEDDEPAKEIPDVKPVKEKSLLANIMSKKMKKIEAFVDKESLLKDKIKEKFNKVMDAEITRISDDLVNFTDKTNHSRQLIKERIEFVVRETSKGMFSVVEYGSCTTRLLTPFSDMDLAIDGGSAPMDRSHAIEFLQILNENLELCNFVVDRKPILTASVPVLKLEANPSIAFKNLPCSETATTVKVDIIVKTKEYFEAEHTSTRTTSYIIKSREAYPTFFRNMLVFKFSLNCLQLMNAYKGGLNSYGLCLLYIAYLVSYHQEQSNCHGSTFFGFLDFVCNEFDPVSQVINLNNFGKVAQQCLFPRGVHNTLAPLIIFDPTHFYFNNVTATCQSFESIVDFLRGVMDGLSRVKTGAFDTFWPEFEQTDNVSRVPQDLDLRIEQFVLTAFGGGPRRLIDSLLGLKPFELCSGE